jgi:glutamine amidotransferase
MTSVGGAEGLIAVLDYGIGNLRSAEKALQSLGAPARLVDDPGEAAEARGVVLPGVGAFAACADALRASGLDQVALAAVEGGVPFLGICVGYQLLYERSDESVGARGLGVFPGSVVRLAPEVKSPQMQWNQLVRRGATPSVMLEGLGESPWVYFVHSFAPEIGPETVAVCDYGGQVAAAAEHRNVWGTQFHPEKSGPAGLDILANFVRRCGVAGPSRAGALGS